jgi:uncharacterized protein YjbJ (UPF0337 family)
MGMGKKAKGKGKAAKGKTKKHAGKATGKLRRKGRKAKNASKH